MKAFLVFSFSLLLLVPTLSEAADHDDRFIERSDQIPHRWVGRLLLDNQIICSAFLVSRNIAMTAGHCIFDQQDRVFRNLTFQVDLGDFDPKFSQNSRFPQPLNRVLRISALRFSPQTNFVNQTSREASEGMIRGDIALLALETSLPADFGFFQLERQVNLGAPAMSIGYPKWQSEGYRVVDPDCAVRDTNFDAFLTDCALDFGNSGGPLVLRNNQFSVAGVASSAKFDIFTGRMVREESYQARFASRYTAIPLYLNRIEQAMRRIHRQTNYFTEF